MNTEELPESSKNFNSNNLKYGSQSCDRLVLPDNGGPRIKIVRHRARCKFPSVSSNLPFCHSQEDIKSKEHHKQEHVLNVCTTDKTTCELNISEKQVNIELNSSVVKTDDVDNSFEQLGLLSESTTFDDFA